MSLEESSASLLRIILVAYCMSYGFSRREFILHFDEIDWELLLLICIYSYLMHDN